MNQMAAVADLLARSDRSFIRTQHRNRTIKLWALAAFGVLYAFTLEYGLTRLLAGWHGEDWSSLWIDVALPAFPIGMSIAQIVLWPDDRARLFAPVAHLRGALCTGDPTLAPPAASMPYTTDALGTIQSDRIGPLRRIRSVETIGWIIGGAAILLVVFVVAVPLALSGSMPQLAAIFVATCLPPIVVLLLLAWRYARPIYVRVNDRGLRWRGLAGRLHRLPWQDAYSFFTLTYPRLMFPRLWRISNDTIYGLANDTIYGLAAESSGLAWLADIGTPAQDGRLSPSAALLRLIRERTRLPLLLQRHLGEQSP